MRNVFVGVVVVMVLIVTVVCAKSVSETESKFGGSYGSCIELGYEKAMCKRVFEF